MAPLEHSNRLEIDSLSRSFENLSTSNFLAGLTRARSASFCSAKELPNNCSPTARTKLISALETNSVASLHKEALDFPPLELTVFLYALKNEPYLADNREALASCLLRLSLTFTTMNQCSTLSWENLLTLLEQTPTFHELATFLREDTLTTLSQVDIEFYATTWSRLSRAFCLDALNIKDAFTQKVLKSWARECSRDCHTIVSLAFVGYLLVGDIQEDISIDHLVQNSVIQEFIFSSIAKMESSTKSFYFVHELVRCSEMPVIKYLERLTAPSLSSLEQILFQSSLECLNPQDRKNDAALVLCASYAVIHKRETCSIEFFHKIAILLIELEKDDFTFDDDKGTLVNELFSKTWNTCALSLTGDADFFEAYRSMIDVYMSFCFPVLDRIPIHADSLLIKIFTAFLKGYQGLKEEWEASDKSSLSKAIRIKASLIQVFYYIFENLKEKKSKKAIFNLLYTVFSVERITDSDKEFLVEEYDYNGRIGQGFWLEKSFYFISEPM